MRALPQGVSGSGSSDWVQSKRPLSVKSVLLLIGERLGAIQTDKPPHPPTHLLEKANLPNQLAWQNTQVSLHMSGPSAQLHYW